MICIPATLIGVLVGILFVWKRGKELDEDPEFLERMKDPEFVKNLEGSKENTIETIAPGAVKSVVIFGIAVALVVLFGTFPELLPEFSN